MSTQPKKIWQLELATGIITEVVTRFENEKGSMKIVRKDGCLYCSAINAKNADKKFIKMVNNAKSKRKK